MKKTSGKKASAKKAKSGKGRKRRDFVYEFPAAIHDLPRFCTQGGVGGRGIHTRNVLFDHGQLIATDGRILVCVGRYDAECDVSFQLGAKDLRWATRAPSKNDTISLRFTHIPGVWTGFVRVMVSPGLVRIGHGEPERRKGEKARSVYCVRIRALIEGDDGWVKFPDVRQMMDNLPAGKKSSLEQQAPADAGYFDPARFARLLTFFARMAGDLNYRNGEDRGVSFRLFQWGAKEDETGRRYGTESSMTEASVNRDGADSHICPLRGLLMGVENRVKPVDAEAKG